MAKIFIDAYSDCSVKEAEAEGLYLAPSKIRIGKKIYNSTDKVGFSQEEIIAKIKKGECSVVPLTVKEWVDFFRPYLDNGDDIIFFTIAQNLMNDGGLDLQSAFCILEDDYPDRKCVLLDTQTVSRGTSEIAMLTNIYQKSETDITKIIAFANKLIGRYITVLAVDDVESLKCTNIFKKVSKNFLGATLNIKPIISINPDGDIKIVEKVQGFKTAVNKLYAIVAQNGENIADYTFSIVNFGASEEANKLFNKFETQVEPSDIRNLTASVHNAINIGGRVVGITFHAKKYDR